VYLCRIEKVFFAILSVHVFYVFADIGIF